MRHHGPHLSGSSSAPAAAAFALSSNVSSGKVDQTDALGEVQYREPHTQPHQDDHLQNRNLQSVESRSQQPAKGQDGMQQGRDLQLPWRLGYQTATSQAAPPNHDVQNCQQHVLGHSAGTDGSQPQNLTPRQAGLLEAEHGFASTPAGSCVVVLDSQSDCETMDGEESDGDALMAECETCSENSDE